MCSFWNVGTVGRNHYEAAPVFFLIFFFSYKILTHLECPIKFLYPKCLEHLSFEGIICSAAGLWKKIINLPFKFCFSVDLSQTICHFPMFHFLAVCSSFTSGWLSVCWHMNITKFFLCHNNGIVWVFKIRIVYNCFPAHRVAENRNGETTKLLANGKKKNFGHKYSLESSQMHCFAIACSFLY